ncbi:MAG: glycosyltransferase [Candidatus Cloacimonadales bacterium]|nr:glycosyltransferase [Candidatus Cloacimonadales bacterium]
MKIAYILSADPFEENGVNKKIKSQTDTWKSFGHNVKIFSILVNEGTHRTENYFNSSIYQREKIFILPKSFRKDLTDFKPDIVYLRFEVFKPFHLSILKSFNVIVEINTNDIVEFKLQASKSIREKIRLIYHLLTRWIIFKYAKGIISVTDELLSKHYMNKYKKPSLVIPNNLILKNFKILKKSNNKIPNLVFMGTSDYPWHGIEKIIELAKETENELFFHIIGSEDTNYPNLKNVKFYGYLLRKDYEKIIEKCDIGISTLSLHKINMNEASSLKLREYLAYGLPSIIGYRDTAFINSIPKWILEIPNEESNLLYNKNRIIDFCNRMKDVIVTHEESKKYIDSKLIEKNRMNFMENLIQSEKQ